MRCTGRHRNPPCAEIPHVPAWPIPEAGFWVGPWGWGHAGVSPREAGWFCGTFWGPKALSPGYALGKFDLLAVKASHFPWGMRTLSWVGSSHCCPSLCHPPEKELTLMRACMAAHPSRTPACSAQGGSGTHCGIKSSLFPNGNHHPGDLETQSSSVSKAIGFQRLRSKGPPGSDSARPSETPVIKGTSF